MTESSAFYIWCKKRNAPRQANARERQDVPLRSGCSSVWRRSCEFSYCRGDLGKTSKRVNITNPSVLSSALGLTSGGEDLSLIGWSCGSLHKWWGIPSVTFRLILRGGFKSNLRCPLILNHSALFFCIQTMAQVIFFHRTDRYNDGCLLVWDYPEPPCK